MLKVKEMVKGKLVMVKGKLVKKAKGGLTTTELLGIIAVIVLVVIPGFNLLMKNFQGDIQTWFKNITGSIFS